MISEFVLRIEESTALRPDNPKHYIKAAIEACAKEVEAEGCLCEALYKAGIAKLPGGYWSDPFDVPVHDVHCPVALAAKLRGLAS